MLCIEGLLSNAFHIEESSIPHFSVFGEVMTSTSIPRFLSALANLPTQMASAVREGGKYVDIKRIFMIILFWIR